MFYFLTGGGASITRSILMNLIAYTLLLSKYKTSKLHIISLTALIMLIWDPIIYDYGAQLSFLLPHHLYLGSTQSKMHYQKNSTCFRQIFALSLAPIIFTSPILWFYFNTLSPVSFIANIFLLEIIEFLVIIGFFSTLVGFISFDLAAIFHNISLTAMKVMTNIVTILEMIPFGNFYTKTPSIIILLLCYIIIILSISKLKYKKKIIITCLGAGLLIITLEQGLAKKTNITFLDVGQGVMLPSLKRTITK